MVYGLEGSVFIAGAAVHGFATGWGSSRLGGGRRTGRRSPTTAACTSCLPWPAWCAPIGILTLRARSSASAVPPRRRHRPALEAIAYQTQDLAEAMRKDRAPLAELKVDGGAAVNDLLMQFQADLLGVDVLRPVVAETTALGARHLAGLAVGFWHDTADLSARWALDRRLADSFPLPGASAMPAMASGRRALAGLGRA